MGIKKLNHRAIHIRHRAYNTTFGSFSSQNFKILMLINKINESTTPIYIGKNRGIEICVYKLAAILKYTKKNKNTIKTNTLLEEVYKISFLFFESEMYFLKFFLSVILDFTNFAYIISAYLYLYKIYE